MPAPVAVMPTATPAVEANGNTVPNAVSALVAGAMANVMSVPPGTTPVVALLKVSDVAVRAVTVVPARMFSPLTGIPTTMPAVEAKGNVVLLDGVSALVTAAGAKVTAVPPGTAAAT